MSKLNEPVREVPCQYDDNGRPYFVSYPSHKNIKVRAACDHPPHYPGIIIFVHGVNSTGEWYATAEKNICKGLNTRLGLNDTPFALVPNQYNCDNPFDFDNYKKDRRILNAGEARSPVVRFYWGYRSPDGEEDKYQIPLVNRWNEDYHALKEQGVTPEKLRAKGPWFWGGGPFQNGTNNLVSLWGETGFNEKLRYLGARVQTFAPDFDRLLTSAPPRRYYAHTAKRLADLLDFIRETYPSDTVSVISHSQGTMIALAATALAKTAPDALFILNSPYAMQTKVSDYFSLPDREILSDNAREQTLAAIIEKIAGRASVLPPEKYPELIAGKTEENTAWTPAVKHRSALLQTTTTTVSGYDYVASGNTYPAVEKQPCHESTLSERWIPERDNHGRLYIYFNPHDRVMGSSPLLSLGWQGLPNTGVAQTPHPFITKYHGHLVQRMMARGTPCGGAPNPVTPFWPLPDGKPFWDDSGDFLTYNTPAYQTVNINGEEVPDPILAIEMTRFDEKREGDGMQWDKKPTSSTGIGWGQYSERPDNKGHKIMTPNDDTFTNYLLLYPKIQVPTGAYHQTGHDYPKIEPVMRLETDEERRIRVGAYISQPTDHSTLPKNRDFMERVVAFDLPVGFCDATWDKAFMATVRAKADWTKGYDDYFIKGELSVPPMPAMISTEMASEEKRAEWEAENKKLNAQGRPSTSVY
ncbi:T6SS effector phospholipase Tle3 domain-containing protein [Chimaeribacter arupi]|uniref:T6SS effector phospholipase Tle3 domain-containing protein n=1 Tax=Chimaeribacter arupi TaxID=2060066 RepID=UPI0019D46614|nr:alpha/beta fold hydrolase [Chimaeribacter arupi]